MALTRWMAPSNRHTIDDAGKVNWLELFFDLIFVAALIQLGDRLAGDVTWGGFARFAGAFFVLWWVWTGTTMLVNRFAVDDVTHRVLTFVQMFAIGNFAIVATSDAIDNRSAWLVVAYIGARLPMLAMYLRVRRRIPEAKAVTDLFLAVFTASPILLAASLLFDPSIRWWIWVVALGVEFAAPIIGVVRQYGPPTHSHHFQERYALFTIIVLGETFVKTLSEINKIGVSIQTQVFGGLAFISLIAIWWTYFDDVAESDVATRSRLTKSPGLNRLMWVYAHLPLTMGLTAFGVASKKIVGVESFDDTLKYSYAWLLVGTLALVLVTVAVLDAVTISPHFGVRTSAQVGLRILAAVMVVGIGALLAAGTVTAIVGLGLVAVIVVAQITLEVMLASSAERRVDIALSEHAEGDGCEHLAAHDARPAMPATLTCQPCDAKGAAWVQLRLCLDCGHVGCCDDSPGGHATAHYRETGHLTMATLEPGDTWAYCFGDNSTDPAWWTDHDNTPV